MSAPIAAQRGTAARIRIAVMHLLVSDARTLRGIERDLAGSDPRLKALFSTFTLVMRNEELPSVERLGAGPVRQLRDRCGPLPWAGMSTAGGRLFRPLLQMLMALACVLAAAGVGVAQAAIACGRGLSLPRRGHSWGVRESPWPRGK